MQYQTLYLNDNGTAKVQMTIDDRTLEQDIDLGSNQEAFQANVEAAMVVFKAELDTNSTPEFTPELNVPVTVESLPTLEEE